MGKQKLYDEDEVNTLVADNKRFRKELEEKPAGAVNKAQRRAPWATSGEVGKGSGGFRLSKALYALRTGERDRAKDEIEACRRFAKALKDVGYAVSDDPNTLTLPLGTELLSADVTDQPDYRVFKSMWDAGAAGADPDEMEWLVKKTAHSYLLDTLGGTLVAPPVQGELIELMRPKEALLAAGATLVPLPPNGRIVYPRQTGASSMYWVGENTSITESNTTTGQIALQAKKGAVYQTLPNELIRYATAAADALIRNDSAKTLALGVDYAGLYGTGGSAQPKGLILYTGTDQLIDYAGLTPAPKGVATHGNVLRPEDACRMAGLVEDRNFEFGGWIFRPTMAHNVLGYRADAVTAADAAGSFVQGMMRAISDRIPTDNWGGYKVTKSAIVRANQTKGSGTNLTEVFGGQWDHLLVGMHGAVEVSASNVAGTTFQQDQTAVRALVHCDIAPRYEGSFIYYKQLLNSTNQP